MRIPHWQTFMRNYLLRSMMVENPGSVVCVFLFGTLVSYSLKNMCVFCSSGNWQKQNLALYLYFWWQADIINLFKTAQSLRAPFFISSPCSGTPLNLVAALHTQEIQNCTLSKRDKVVVVVNHGLPRKLQKSRYTRAVFAGKGKMTKEEMDAS